MEFRRLLFGSTIVVAVGFSIISIADLVQVVLAPAIGEVPYGSDPTLQLAIRPLPGVIPWTFAWWAHVRWLRREPAAADPLRALHQARLATHAPAAIAIALGGAGLGWLLRPGVDIAFGGPPRAPPDS